MSRKQSEDGPPSGGLVRVDKIKAQCVRGSAQIIRNMRHAFSLGLPTVRQIDAHDGVAVLCGSGPSIRRFIPDIAQLKKQGALVCAVKGAHDFLIDNGITPHMAVAVDPQEKIAECYRKPQKGVRYYIASQCHADVFKALDNQHVVLWNLYVKSVHDYWQGATERSMVGHKLFFINGGSTSGLRAITLLYVMGYRRIHLYGFDSCLTNRELKITGERVDNDDEIMVFVADGRTFYCNGAMAVQAQEIVPQAMMLPGLRIKAHGTGLIPWMVQRFALRGVENVCLTNEDWDKLDHPLRGSIQIEEPVTPCAPTATG
jgi:uncharacterized Rossmann fold enzyme